MLLADAVGCDGDAADGNAESSTSLGYQRRWVILHAAGHPRRLVATRRLVIQAAAWSPRRLVSAPCSTRRTRWPHKQGVLVKRCHAIDGIAIMTSCLVELVAQRLYASVAHTQARRMAALFRFSDNLTINPHLKYG